ncbi:alpha/beta hydrolase [Sphingomonas ginkgonis]|uniref:Alpha/beta hydrolase n=2 Tax=Sphingomonas ginkgonis TaxID=2315330 RepID=A0A429VEH3_9SPHN|nr:alpha/beta hydrolase [Sphingomonas ginkgonis]
MMAASAPASPPATHPISLAAFKALPRPTPTAELSFGRNEPQKVDIFLPNGAGPYPVVVLIHGGCWSKTTAGRQQLRHLGAELAAQGIAAWSIGYRRADEYGGGFPGTFDDVARAIDLLEDEAPRYQLDLRRVAFVGHSAGGHLALWAASRATSRGGDAIEHPVRVKPVLVISLAGITDLHSFAPTIPSLCGPGVLEALTGTSTGRASATTLARISPAHMPLPDTRVVLVSGGMDQVVPASQATDYVNAHHERRSSIEQLNLPETGHFDLVTPGTSAWRRVSKLLLEALQPK